MNSLKKIFKTWFPYIQHVQNDGYMRTTMSYLNQQYKDNYIYPKKRDVFKVFNKVDFDDVRVVVIGGFPYQDSRATGIAFAQNTSFENRSSNSEIYQIEKNIEKNIYKGINLNFDTSLEHWLKQGVIPLHLSMTTNRDRNDVHEAYWYNFLKIVVSAISEYNNGVIFVLLGDYAEKKCGRFINKNTSYTVSASYPKGTNIAEDWDDKCFNKVNEILIKNGEDEIKW